jgi:D-erythritol 1-phosphate dehydrogenase
VSAYEPDAEMKDHGTVDIAVIGGGVNGAGIARDAAGRGLSVLLCEKGDFAEGTSVALGKARSRRPALPGVLQVQACA